MVLSPYFLAHILTYLRSMRKGTAISFHVLFIKVPDGLLGITEIFLKTMGQSFKCAKDMDASVSAW